jgi:hypothetical protein
MDVNVLCGMFMRHIQTKLFASFLCVRVEVWGAYIKRSVHGLRLRVLDDQIFFISSADEK